MFRPTLPIFAFLCLIVLAVSAAPAAAQPQGPIVVNPAFLIRTVTVMGAGETEELAEENALYVLGLTYHVFSHTSANSMCWPLPSDPSTDFCSVEVTAKVIRKVTFIKE